jgi:HSP20 family protein
MSVSNGKEETMASSLSPFNPFRDFSLSSPLRSMDEFMREFGNLGGGSLREWQGGMIGIDVHETDQAYNVRAEIPGVKKDDIRVTVEGNRVTIAAETERRDEQRDGGRVIRSELYRGQMHRSFTLDHDVDDQAAEAKYTDGVLTLTLPKKQGGRGGKNLPIQ